jgi:cholesterol oxidase
MRRARATAGFSRRQLLRLGISAAGITLTPIAWSSRAAAAITALPASVDHAAAAQQAYRSSLARLRRSVPRPDGWETWESNIGTLTSPPSLLRASRGARGSQADFDVLIVGSGYGGAVCAARLAGERRPGVKIAVLERGREWVPGTFPDRLASFNPFARRRPSWLSEQLSNNPLGLYGFHMGDVPVVTGNGLGGASLTNCAVALEAKDYVFDRAAWPDELRSRDALGPYYARANRMLAPRPTAEDRFTPKLRTHLGTAGNLVRSGVWRAAAYPTPLAITVGPQCAGHVAARLRAVRRLCDRV